MNTMPGFSAEVSLNRVTEFYQMSPRGGHRQRARILPQAVRGSFTIAGHDPDNICIYRTCTITIYDVGASANCRSQNVCAHPR
jgi:hypothetical protein